MSALGTGSMAVLSNSEKAHGSFYWR